MVNRRLCEISAYAGHIGQYLIRPVINTYCDIVPTQDVNYGGLKFRVPALALREVVVYEL